MRRYMTWLGLVLLLVPTLGWASGASYRLDDQVSAHNIGLNLAYLPGHTHLSFEQIADLPLDAWQLNTKRSLGLPPSREGVWGRLEVSKHSNPNSQWLLVMKWPIIDLMQVRLYYPLRGTWGPVMQDGDRVPLKEHTVNHRFLLYPLELPLQEPVVIYFRAQAHEALALPMQLLTEAELTRQETLYLAVIYLFFGGMLAIMLYNGCLYIFTRDHCYIAYIFYLCCVVGYELTLTGLGQQYLWGDWTRFSVKAYGLFASLTFLSSLIFARYFLKLRSYGGWLYHTNTLFIGYWALMAASVLFYPILITYLLPTLMPLITTVLAVCVTGVLWARGNISAKHFTLAWSVLIIFTMIHLLAIAGHLPLTAFTLGSQMFGVYIEFILLSIALAERINREREQRIAAQHAALSASQHLAKAHEEKLIAQQKTLAAQREAKELLEIRVAERTHDLEQTQDRLEKAIQELAELSIKDSLTGLYNRRHFDNTAPSEIARAKRTQVPLAILMLDIDYFKHVNDHYGHLFGDECLRQVASIIQKNTQRAGDLSARYGGEEFIVLLPATTPERAAQVAEKIRIQVEQLTLEHVKGVLKPTISVGISSLDLDSDEDIARLVHHADLALYEAKKSGRNQVCIHQERVNS